MGAVASGSWSASYGVTGSEMEGVIDWGSSIISPFFRDCSLGSIFHILLLSHLSDCLFSIHLFTHSSAHIHPSICPSAYPYKLLYIHLCMWVIYISSILLLPSFLFSFCPSIHLYPFISPHPSTPSHLPLTWLYTIYTFTLASQLLSLSIYTHSFVQIHPYPIHPPCYLSIYSIVQPYTTHSCLSPIHPSSIHLSVYITYLFFYTSIHANSITPAYDYVIHFDKEIATKGLICLPFPLSSV